MWAVSCTFLRFVVNVVLALASAGSDRPDLSEMYGYFLDVLCHPQVWVAIILIVAALVFLGRRAGSQRVEPPGPWGLPIVGYLPFLGRKTDVAINRLAKRYGGVFQMRMGSRKVVVISGQNCIRKALMESGTTFAGRPDFYTTQLFGDNFSSIDYSPSYRVYKKHTLKSFSQFTKVRREELQQVAHNAVKMLLKEFKIAKNEPFDPKPILFKSVCSILGYICYGGFYDGDSEEVTTLLEKSDDFGKFMAFGVLCDFFPWTKFLIRKQLQKLNEIAAIMKSNSDKLALAHIEDYDGETIRDISDMFRKVAEDMDEDERKALNINDYMLKAHVSALFGGGIGTTSYTLLYGMMIMALYPELQARVQDEIDAVVGRDRLPEFEDKGSLPFTVATVTEIYRHHSLSALGVTLATTCDTELEGYFIPKKTPVIINYYSANYDETVFTDPQKFDPDRFMTESGPVDMTLSQYVVAFGLGRRRCPGELVARMDVLLFFATILQQCTIEQAPGHPLDLNDYVMGLGRMHAPFKVVFRSRNGDW